MENVGRVEFAISCLKLARDSLRRAGAPKATHRVRLALSSAKGALRHAHNEPYRKERQRKGGD